MVAFGSSILIQFLVSFQSGNYLDEEERAGCFALIVFLVIHCMCLVLVL